MSRKRKKHFTAKSIAVDKPRVASPAGVCPNCLRVGPMDPFGRCVTEPWSCVSWFCESLICVWCYIAHTADKHPNLGVVK